ncbi:MAG TPA: hypothetical protein PKA95_00925 [Thermomicrobiales bacterium]|nr:hypothetical protein [Thermomicrobiales bacterium]
MPADQAGGPMASIPASMLARLVTDVWHPIEVKVILGLAAIGGVADPVREETLLGDAA